MRATQYLLATLKEIPKNCNIISHQLMLRAGMIRKVSSGLYIWLPTGLRVLRKIENIIREEMNNIGFFEILMPIIQPAKLWKQSGRWSEYGTELLRFKNRNKQDYILSPTHEEIVSDFICQEITSSKQFPINVYQIHTKYRDEARPQFGVIRSREFIMKDGYSFHTSHISLQNTYYTIYQKYHTIFNRIGLNFYVVRADPGKIGGMLSHEFQAYSNSAVNKIEIPVINHNHLNKPHIKSNKIIFCKKYLNFPKKIITSIKPSHNIYSISKFLNQFNILLHETIQIITVRSTKEFKNNFYNLLGLVIRSDHQLCSKKLFMIPEIFFPLSILNLEETQSIIGITPNLINFIKLSIPLIVDYKVAIMDNFIIKSNIYKKYLFEEKNWNQILPTLKIADLHKSKFNNYKNIKKLNRHSINNNIEIGHIFQLGEKYSNKIHNCIQKNIKYNLKLTMGCYGIGITRMIAAIIEQNYDKHGIVWPDEIAPFKLAIVPINIHYSTTVRNVSEKLYNQLLSLIGIDVLIDDRLESPGIIFTDIDLIGIPHILIISDRNLNNHEVEYKHRKSGIIIKIKLNEVLQFLAKKLINK